MRVDKGLIIKRISMYGNSFKVAGEYLKEHLEDLADYDASLVVLYSLIATKQARLDYLLNLPNRNKHTNEAIKDTKHDLANYLWIKDNYDEYLGLVRKYCNG